ncbi:uncharacterized protein METZ01_LOCUS48594, partial [marine metagenome]
VLGKSSVLTSNVTGADRSYATRRFNMVASTQ